DKASASLDRVLSVAELRQLSLRDLRLLRNTIYARRGRPFKSKVLQAHFSAMSWYRKDEAYTDARLTANDKRNIDLIRAVENEFGGPLQDEDWLVDPATDGA
ncbi:MAG TPA: YARHG domain-containing protein, partial [Archangium sp.]|nr:YARHG domain-containing protein [Archangium sp.]